MPIWLATKDPRPRQPLSSTTVPLYLQTKDPRPRPNANPQPHPFHPPQNPRVWLHPASTVISSSINVQATSVPSLPSTATFPSSTTLAIVPQSTGIVVTPSPYNLKQLPRIPKIRANSTACTSTVSTALVSQPIPPVTSPYSPVSITLNRTPPMSESTKPNPNTSASGSNNNAFKQSLDTSQHTTPETLATPCLSLPASMSTSHPSTSNIPPTPSSPSPTSRRTASLVPREDDACYLKTSPQTAFLPLTPPPTPTIQRRPSLPTTISISSQHSNPNGQVDSSALIFINNPKHKVQKPTQLMSVEPDKPSTLQAAVLTVEDGYIPPGEPMDTNQDHIVFNAPCSTPPNQFAITNPELKLSKAKDRRSASPLRPAFVISGQVKKSSPLARTMTDASGQIHRVVTARPRSAPFRRTSRSKTLYMGACDCNPDGSREHCIYCRILKGANAFCMSVDSLCSEMEQT